MMIRALFPTGTLNRHTASLLGFVCAYEVLLINGSISEGNYTAYIKLYGANSLGVVP